MKAMALGKASLQIYRVAAQVHAGDDNSTVWEGSFDDIVATSQCGARKVAAQRIIDTVSEYDARIQPGIRIVSVGRAEVDPVLLANRIVAESRKNPKESLVVGELHYALQLCLESMSAGQIAGVLQHIQIQK